MIQHEYLVNATIADAHRTAAQRRRTRDAVVAACRCCRSWANAWRGQPCR